MLVNIKHILRPPLMTYQCLWVVITITEKVLDSAPEVINLERSMNSREFGQDSLHQLLPFLDIKDKYFIVVEVDINTQMMEII